MLLGWLGLSCLGYLFTQLQRCEPAVQLLLPLPLLSNPDSSLESDDHNTELDPATSETTSIVPDLEATSFIRKDQQSYACMAWSP